MTVLDTINRVFREFKRYTGDGLPGEPTGSPLPNGDPQSGVHSPKKSEIRTAMGELFTAVATALQQAIAAAAIATGAASLFQATVFSTKALAEAYAPEFAPDYIRTEGYYTAGDGGGALYKKVASEPTHAAKFSITLDDAVTVAWYELASQRLFIRQFGAVGDGTTNDTAEVQAAVTFAAGAPLYDTGGTYLITTSIDCCDSTQLFTYRPGVKIIGAGIGKTKFLNNAADACFVHMVTETQGASNYFTRGVEFAHLEIIGDGSTPADSSGIKIQGTYHPWFHDMNINTMTKDGIEFTEETPGWAGTPNPDRYAVADAVVERCNLSGNENRGVGVYNAACQLKLRASYITSNLKAGIGPYGSVHEIHGNSISGNGTFGDAESGGIVAARHPTWGTPQNHHIYNNEIDANRNRQILLDGANCIVEHNRFNDDPTWYVDSGGEFLAAVQVEIAPAASSSADGNVVRKNSFRFTTITDKNCIAVRFNMAVTGDRNMNRNLHEGTTIGLFGATSGVITEHAEVNTTHALAVGNRWLAIDVPVGVSKIVSSTRDMTTASGSQTIAFAFKPAKVRATAWVVGTDHKSEGEMSIDGVDGGLYYYPTGAGWFTHSVLINIRTGAGDIYTATGTLTPGGLVLAWVKTGSPTGTIDFTVYAEG